MSTDHKQVAEFPILWGEYDQPHTLAVIVTDEGIVCDVVTDEGEIIASRWDTADDLAEGCH